jgi:hypothetical protein
MEDESTNYVVLGADTPAPWAATSRPPDRDALVGVPPAAGNSDGDSQASLSDGGTGNTGKSSKSKASRKRNQKHKDKKTRRTMLLAQQRKQELGEEFTTWVTRRALSESSRELVGRDAPESAAPRERCDQ